MKRIFTIIAILISVVTQTNAEEMKINVVIGNKTFAATIADTETGHAFYNLLPLSLNMNELNGNEKYCYLDNSLPTASYRPGTIKAGDLMLYGSSCVVLFYETFSSGYSYTGIGAIDKPEGLAEALGSGNVSVKFQKETSAVTAIASVDSDESVMAIYDINGNKMTVDNADLLPHGIYVMKYANGKTKKIIQ